jgi:signal transduction histidine kinase
MPSGPLRPEVAARSKLGRWLHTQTSAIVPAWISAVRLRPPVHVQGTQAPPIVESALQDIYDGLAIALEVGRYDELEKSAIALVKTHHPVGYSLGDLLKMLMLLKENLWLAITAVFAVEEALTQLHGLDAVFWHLEMQVNLAYVDETEHSLRDELEQTKWRLEKLDRNKSDFISIAAHELKTPLTIIQGYSDLLNLELARDLNEQRHSALTGLAAGAQRLSVIIQDMIAVSQIDNEVLTLHYQPVALQNIARIAVSDLELAIPDRKLALIVKDFPAHLLTFYADPQRLYLVFNHVIGNSIKYTPDGGKIVVSASVLDEESDAMRLVDVSVADTGIGIAPEDLERIFDKFYGVTEPLRHSSGRTKFKGGGPGLGLAVAKGIVEAHGGRIWAESPGYDEQRCPGSTFHFVLPIRKQPPEPTRGQERLSQISNTQ